MTLRQSPGEARRLGAKALGAAGAGAATVGGAGYGAYRAGKSQGKKKQSSAIDEYAAELAIQKIAESQYWDVDEAVERVGALLTLGTPESEKIAAATDLNEAVEARSLELLELAGYPIDWNQQ